MTIKTPDQKIGVDLNSRPFIDVGSKPRQKVRIALAMGATDQLNTTGRPNFDTLGMDTTGEDLWYDNKPMQRPSGDMDQWEEDSIESIKKEIDAYYSELEAKNFGSDKDWRWFMGKKRAYEIHITSLKKEWPTDKDYKGENNMEIDWKDYLIEEDLDEDGNFNMPIIGEDEYTGKVYREQAEERVDKFDPLPETKVWARLAFINNMSAMEALEALGVELDPEMDQGIEKTEQEISRLRDNKANPTGFVDVRAKGTKRVKVNKHWKFSNTSEVGFDPKKGETGKLEPSGVVNFARSELQTKRKHKTNSREDKFWYKGGRFGETSLKELSELQLLDDLAGWVGSIDEEGTDLEKLQNLGDSDWYETKSWTPGYVHPNGFVDPRFNFQGIGAEDKKALAIQRKEIADYLNSRNFGSERRQARRTGTGTVFR